MPKLYFVAKLTSLGSCFVPKSYFSHQDRRFELNSQSVTTCHTQTAFRHQLQYRGYDLVTLKHLTDVTVANLANQSWTETMRFALKKFEENEKFAKEKGEKKLPFDGGNNHPKLIPNCQMCHDFLVIRFVYLISKYPPSGNSIPQSDCWIRSAGYDVDVIGFRVFVICVRDLVIICVVKESEWCHKVGVTKTKGLNVE